MLFRLRHPAVVGRDDEQGKINRPDARDHVLNEVLVPRHIYDSNTEWRVEGTELKMRKA